MKKILIALICALMVMGFACALAESVASLTAEEYAAMTPEALLAAAHIADQEKLTAEEYVSLLETYRFVPIDDDSLTLTDYQSITRQALDAVSKAQPPQSAYFVMLLQSPYPQARGIAYEGVSDFLGAAEEDVTAVLEALKTEEDPYCLLCAVNGLRNQMKTRAEVADFIFRMADHEHSVIRKAAAVAIGNSWSIGVEGTVEKIITLIGDEDEGVRKSACAYAGKLHDDRVVPALVAVLNDPSQASVHGDAVRGLSYLWLDYPYHAETSEAAYRATLDYYAKTPRDAKVPSWSGIGSFNTVNARKIADWYGKAGYFNADAFFDVMADFIMDPDASSLGKTPAMKAIIALCPEKFADLDPLMAACEDKKLVDSYNNLKSQQAGK